jgi:SpoVK/Ycf46/Vps4 family AAA+-type ATPase
MRKAIATAESVAPCLLWIDELEKGFSGTQSSGISDGGTTSRVFGTFLSWMQDKKAPVFVIATSNDVSALPPELMRKGRFDEIFFVDLPAHPERKEIFTIHLRKRGREVANHDVDLLARKAIGFSGAEIEQVVVSALYTSFHDGARDLNDNDMLDVIKVSVPLSRTMREGIAELRYWASDRARPVASAEAEDLDMDYTDDDTA